VRADAPRLLFSGTPVLLARGGTSSELVSVLLVVRDQAAQLRHLLPRVLDQHADATVELLAVDLGSTDDTIEVLRQFNATVLAIAGPVTASHARNLVSRYANGSALVFVDPGVIPADDQWLPRMLAPLHADASIAGVSSRVLPWPEADVLVRRDAERDPSASPERRLRTITDWAAYRAMTPDELRTLLSFSLVSASIRKEALQRFPFNVGAREDTFWSKQVLEAGWTLQHEPGSLVRYSPPESLAHLLQRSIDEGVGDRKTLSSRVSTSEAESAMMAAIKDDWRVLDETLGPAARDLEERRMIAASRRTAQMLGRWLGADRASGA
jgi:hypothetical protein